GSEVEQLLIAPALGGKLELRRLQRLVLLAQLFGGDAQLLEGGREILEGLGHQLGLAPVRGDRTLPKRSRAEAHLLDLTPEKVVPHGCASARALGRGRAAGDLLHE